MAFRGVDNTSPEAAYNTKPNIVMAGYGATPTLAEANAQAKADSAENYYRAQVDQQGNVNGLGSAPTNDADPLITVNGSWTWVAKGG